ncbi:MAG: YjfB family protein [Treponema sp.]|nr:YjfB family protein [Treponema sp.]
MNISALSTAISQGTVQQQASLAMTKKTMNAMEQTGQAVLQLLQSVALPPPLAEGIGKNIDVYA